MAPGQQENTIAGVQAAFSAGADAVEVDVRATGDGTPILHHDRHLDGLPVAETPFSKLEDQASIQGYRLATVEQLLDAAANQGPVNLEIKDPRATEPVLDLVEARSGPPVFISGFDRSVVRDVHARTTSVPTGLILSAYRAYRLLFSRRRVQRLRAWLTQPDPDVLVLERRFLRLGLASRVLSLGRPVAVWTVNRDRRLLRTMQNPLVWGVITDRPSAAHRARNLSHADGATPTRTGIDSTSNRSRQPG